jgi:hypothetical protein
MRTCGFKKAQCKAFSLEELKAKMFLVVRLFKNFAEFPPCSFKTEFESKTKGGLINKKKL